MRSTPLLAAGLVALASAADDCKPDYSGKFEITVVQPSDLSRQAFPPHVCSDDPDALIMTLSGGVLHDANNRTGSIVSNHQFQFDQNTQVNAIATSGFAVCESNGFLSFNGSTEFSICNSGDFANLYSKSIGGQCSNVNIIAMPCDDNGGEPPCNYVPVSQISDGQIQAPTAIPPAPSPTEEPSAGFTPTSVPTQAPQTTSRPGSGGNSSPQPGPAAPPVGTGVPTSSAVRSIIDAKAALAVALVALFAL